MWYTQSEDTRQVKVFDRTWQEVEIQLIIERGEAESSRVDRGLGHFIIDHGPGGSDKTAGSIESNEVDAFILKIIA